MRRATAVTWARAYLGCIACLALVVAVLVSGGIDVETPTWNALRIVLFVLSGVAVSVIAIDWMQRRAERRDKP